MSTPLSEQEIFQSPKDIEQLRDPNSKLYYQDYDLIRKDMQQKFALEQLVHDASVVHSNTYIPTTQIRYHYLYKNDLAISLDINLFSNYLPKPDNETLFPSNDPLAQLAHYVGRLEQFRRYTVQYLTPEEVLVNSPSRSRILGEVETSVTAYYFHGVAFASSENTEKIIPAVLLETDGVQTVLEAITTGEINTVLSLLENDATLPADFSTQIERFIKRTQAGGNELARQMLSLARGYRLSLQLQAMVENSDYKNLLTQPPTDIPLSEVFQTEETDAVFFGYVTCRQHLQNLITVFNGFVRAGTPPNHPQSREFISETISLLTKIANNGVRKIHGESPTEDEDQDFFTAYVNARKIIEKAGRDQDATERLWTYLDQVGHFAKGDNYDTFKDILLKKVDEVNKPSRFLRRRTT